MPLLLKFFFTLALSTGLIHPVIAAIVPWYDGHWSHEQSTLVPDKKVIYNTLPNGFRYALVPNPQGGHRVTAYLAVQVGAWMESDDEQGLAHYLEHMAFNGSRRFAPGTLIPFFHQHGMNFGGDSNAYTTTKETVYQLHLTRSDRDTLKSALTVFRDIADGLTLDPVQVDAERGVILAEKAARDTQSSAAARAVHTFLYGQSRFTHQPIGVEKTIKTATSEKLREFYQKWYVPSRMILVIAGDIEPQETQKLIEQEFHSLTGRHAPNVSLPKQTITDDVQFLIQNRPLTHPSISIVALHQRENPDDSIMSRRREWCAKLIQAAINQRLQKISAQKNYDWRSAYFHNATLNRFLPAVALKATLEHHDWKAGLKGLHEQWKLAQTFGLSQSEVTDFKNKIRQALLKDIESSSTLSNYGYAEAIINSENANKVFLSAEDTLAIFDRVKDTITVDFVNTMLNEMLGAQNRRILVRGNTQSLGISEDALRSYWESLQTQPVNNVTRRIESKVRPFPYLTVPDTPTTLPELNKIPLPVKDLKLTQYRATLANGVSIVMLPLPFDRQVNATLLFGDGLNGVPNEALPAARLGVSAMQYSGPGRLTFNDALYALSPLDITVQESMGKKHNAIVGTAPGKHVDKLLQAVWTQFQDPTITMENRNKALEKIRWLNKTIRHTVEGTAMGKRMTFLEGQDPRNTPLTPAQAQATTTAQMQSYVNNVRKRGPRVLILSGAFDPYEVLPVITQLFEAVPQSTDKQWHYAGKTTFPADQDLTLTVENSGLPKAFYVAAWHADLNDISDRYTRSIREILGAIVNERMRLRIREELGIAYTPSASYKTHDNNNGYGFLLLTVETQPKFIPKLRETVDEIVADIVKNGVTREELTQIKKPMLAAWKYRRHTHGLWYGLLLNSIKCNVPSFQWYEEIPPLLSKIDTHAVNVEARHLFKQPRACLIVKSVQP